MRPEAVLRERETLAVSAMSTWALRKEQRWAPQSAVYVYHRHYRGDASTKRRQQQQPQQQRSVVILCTEANQGPSSRSATPRQVPVASTSAPTACPGGAGSARPPHPTGPGPQQQQQQQLSGSIYILVVALLWGSYTPVLRLIYQLDGPPAPLVLAAVRGVAQCLVLLGASLAWPSLTPPTAPPTEEDRATEGAGSGKGGTEAFTDPEPEQGVAVWARQALASAPPWLLGGLELGAYNTLGTTLQTVGLAYTTATRGALLIQTTAIFTPLLAAAGGDSPSGPVWLGSLLALAGAVLVAAEGSSGVGSSDWAAPDGAQLLEQVGGDALTVASAFFYSLATLRIARYARTVPPLSLALGASATLAAASLALLAAEAGQLVLHGQQLAQLWPNWGDPRGWGLILYAGAGPGALAAFLQVKGQSLVSPTRAQILFSTVPLWSVLLAAALLQDEVGGPYTWLGGAVMVVAGLVGAL